MKGRSPKKSAAGKNAWSSKSPAEKQAVLDRLAKARKARGKR